MSRAIEPPKPEVQRNFAALTAFYDSPAASNSEPGLGGQESRLNGKTP